MSNPAVQRIFLIIVVVVQDEEDYDPPGLLLLLVSRKRGSAGPWPSHLALGRDLRCVAGESLGAHLLSQPLVRVRIPDPGTHVYEIREEACYARVHDNREGLHANDR